MTPFLRKLVKIRLLLLAGAMTGIEAVMSFIDGIDARVYAALLALVTSGAFIARTVAMHEEGDDE